MKRDVAIVLLPQGVSPSNVRAPDGSFVLHAWFEEETAARDDGSFVARALARAGKVIAQRVARGQA